MRKLLTALLFLIPATLAAQTPPQSRITIANASVTGTTINHLAKITGAPSTAVITGTGDISGAVGIVVAGAGTTGSAQIQTSGQTPCVFDGSTLAGDYVQLSTTPGDCHDYGVSYPVTGQVVGRVLSTNVSAGTYQIDLFPSEITGNGAGQGYPFIGPAPETDNNNSTYGAANNGSTDDGTANTSGVNNRAANGGKFVIGNNSLWTPPGSWTAPSFWESIALGGKTIIKGTFALRPLQELTCASPGLANENYNFSDRPACGIYPQTSTISPMLNLAIGSGPYHVQNIGVSGYTGAVGINVGPLVSNIRFDNVVSIPNSNASTPLVVTGGFGHQFTGGSFQAQAGADCSAHPSMFFHSDGANQDFIRLLEIKDTFINTCGIHFDTVGSASIGPVANGFIFWNSLFENGNDCMYCFDTTGTSYVAPFFVNDNVSDNIGYSPMIKVSNSSGSFAFKDPFIFNPAATTLFDVRPTPKYQPIIEGAFIVGKQTSSLTIGLYGPQASYYWFEQGQAVFNSGGANGAPAFSSIGAVGVGLAEPYQPACTASNSGGSLTANTYYVILAYEDSQGQEGQITSDWQVGPLTTTGSSGSIACTWNQSVPGALPAVATRLFLGTALIGQATSYTRFRTTNVGSYTITGSGGTAAQLPTQVSPNTGNMALTDHFGATGNGGTGEADTGNEWLGTTGCVSFGTQGCSGGDTTPGHVQMTQAKTSGTSPQLQLGAQLFSSLPTCNSGATGTIATVSDSTTNTWGATITGSGSDVVGAFCNGSTWDVYAK